MLSTDFKAKGVQLTIIFHPFSFISSFSWRQNFALLLHHRSSDHFHHFYLEQYLSAVIDDPVESEVYGSALHKRLRRLEKWLALEIVIYGTLLTVQVVAAQNLVVARSY